MTPALAQNRILEWGHRYQVATNLSSTPRSIALTEDGAIIVGGTTESLSGDGEYLALKLSRLGEPLWERRFTSDPAMTNDLHAMTSDGAGNVLLTGSAGSVKLDSSGNIVWTSPLAGRAIASNPAFTYVTGSSEGAAQIAQLGNEPKAPVDLILDCDPGEDIDDMSDLAIAHNLMSRGEINLLGTIAAHRASFIAELLQVVNRYYGHRDVEVAIPGNGPEMWDTYAFPVVKEYAASIGYTLPVPDATSTYRRILSSRPDHSVTIVHTGQLRNLLNVWNSGPDEFSRMYGPALLAQKIKEIIIVAGYFPTSDVVAEFNLVTDPEAAQVLNQMTNGTPVTFVGIEIGNSIFVPERGIGQLEAGNPVRYAHEYLRTTNRESWSGPGLLYAARGAAWRGNDYFRGIRGRVKIGPIGQNSFIKNANGNQQYLVKTQPDFRYTAVIDDLLVKRAPSIGPEFDRSGRTLWSEFYAKTNAAVKMPAFAQIDSFGDLIVSGVESSLSGEHGFFSLEKYGEAGRLRWRARGTNSSSPSFNQVQLKSMAVDTNSIRLFGQFGPAGALFNFDPSGTQRWSYLHPDPGLASGMTRGAAGETYIAHSISNSVTITRISKEGVSSGAITFSDRDAAAISIEALTSDTSGNIHLAGARSVNAGGSEVMLLSVNPQFANVSSVTYASQYPGVASVRAIAVDLAGDIYLAATVPTANGGSEIEILKFTPEFKIEKLASGSIQIRAHAAPQQMVALETSGNFMDWQSIVTNRSDSLGVTLFEDLDAAAFAMRFYRTRAEPKD